MLKKIEKGKTTKNLPLQCNFVHSIRIYLFILIATEEAYYATSFLL